MGKKYSNRYQHKNNMTRISQVLRLLPILFTVGIMPFMLRLHVYEPGLNDYSWYFAGAEDYYGDIFLYYRQSWFTVITIYMILVILFYAVANRTKLQRCILCIPLGVYALFSFLSACFSKYPDIAFGGGFEQFENVFVLMGYAVIVYYSLIAIESEAEVRYIIYTLTASTFVTALIGTLQTFGFNLLTTKFIESLIIPKRFDAAFSTSSEDSLAYLTLYNPNYVGVYVAILFMLFIILFVLSKSLWERIAYAATAVLLLISLYGSGSKAAFLVIAFELLIFLVFLWRALLKRWYFILPAALLLISAFLLINQRNDNVFIDRIISALQTKSVRHSLESIDTLDDSVAIRYNGEVLYLSYYVADSDYVVLSARDEQDNAIQVVYNEEQDAYSVDDTSFSDIEFTPMLYGDLLCICVNVAGRDWLFTNQYTDDCSYYYLTDKGKFDKIVTAEQSGFQNYESILTGRGYIWSVTIPLLKDHIVFGSGADTFLMVFPQQDHVRLWRNNFSEQIMSKPHSLYLQTAVQDGIPAALGLLVFFALYLFECVRLYFRSDYKSFYEQIGVATMISVLGFAVMGLTNDSSITVSPIFWAIAGIGVYVNAQVKKARKTACEHN